MEMENNKFGTNQLYDTQTFPDKSPSARSSNPNPNPHHHNHQHHHHQQQIHQPSSHGKSHPTDFNPLQKDVLVPRWLPKCGYCDGLILEEQCTEAEEKVWHLKCFKCFECKKMLGGQQYVMARPTVLRSNETTFNPENEYPYCLACFDAFFAELCEECGDIIGCEVGSIKHEGRHWHANELCFKCNFCKTALLGKLFLPANDGKIYCSAQCYQYILRMYRPSKTVTEKVKPPPPPPPPPSPPASSSATSFSITSHTPSLPPSLPSATYPTAKSLLSQAPSILPTTDKHFQITSTSTTSSPQKSSASEKLAHHSEIIKPHSPSSSSENTPLITRTTLINDKPDIIQDYLVQSKEKEDKKVTKEMLITTSSTPTIDKSEESSTQNTEVSSSLTDVAATSEPCNMQKNNSKSVTFDPSVKENESNRKCRSTRKVVKEDDCCSTCSSHSSSSSDDDFDYDLMDARRRQWIAGTRVHYVAATAQPSSTSTLPKTKNRSKANDSHHSKTKSLHRPIKRFQDCSLNWAEILRSKLKGL